MLKGYCADMSGSKKVVSCDVEADDIACQAFLLEFTPSGLLGRYSYSSILELLKRLLARECRQE